MANEAGALAMLRRKRWTTIQSEMIRKTSILEKIITYAEEVGGWKSTDGVMK